VNRKEVELKMKTTKMKLLLKAHAAPHRVHFTTRLVITVGAIITVALHAVSPLAETISLAGTSITAAWAADIEHFFVEEFDIKNT